MTVWTLLAATPASLFERIGSYAGYAAMIGLGIMALLYFGQARELKRLREWAGREPERALELAQRPQLDPQRRVVAQPLAPSTTAAQSAAAATAALYASVGASAPGAVAPPGQLARPGAATPPVAAPGSLAPGAVPAPAAASSAPGSAPSATPAPAGTPAGTQPPEAAEGAEGQAPAPGASSTVTATPPPAAPPASPTPQAASAAAQFAASRAVQEPALFGNGSIGQPTRESAAARPDPPPPPRGSSSDGRRFGLSNPRLGAIVGGALALLAVGVVIFLVAGNDAEPPKPNDFGNTPAAQEPGDGGAASNSSGSKSSSAITTAERRGTKVAVLNGTTQTGLARNVADELEKKAYTIGGTDNNVDQNLAVTTVAFKPGEERVARDIARIIRVARDLVQPADANTAVASDADVVVTVGADKIG